MYEIESRDRKLVVWGDLIHAKDVQLPRPGVTVQFDVNERAAAAQRKQVLAAAAGAGDGNGNGEDAWIAAAHIAFPGIGRIRKDGRKDYTWAPANYSLEALSGK